MRNKSSFRDRNGNNVIDYPEILDLKWVIQFIAGLKKKKNIIRIRDFTNDSQSDFQTEINYQ